MRRRDLRALAECYKIIEATGDLALCRKLYPEVMDRLVKDVKLQTRLAAFKAPDPEATASARAALLEALKAAQHGGNGAGAK
jgi:hypothetical protein